MIGSLFLPRVRASIPRGPSVFAAEKRVGKLARLLQDANMQPGHLRGMRETTILDTVLQPKIVWHEPVEHSLRNRYIFVSEASIQWNINPSWKPNSREV